MMYVRHFGPPHGTAPATVIANKIKLSSLRARITLVRKERGHTAVRLIGIFVIQNNYKKSIGSIRLELCVSHVCMYLHQTDHI